MTVTGLNCIHGTPDKETKEKTKEIENQLRADAEKMARTVKLLLLGAAECGKSTVLKQMKIIHRNGYSLAESEAFISVILGNIVQSLLQIFHGLRHLEISYSDEERIEDEKLVAESLEAVETDGELQQDVVDAIKRLWEDAGVKECFFRSTEYHLNDSTEYYITNIDRITASG